MKAIVIALALVSTLWGQELPDAPTPQANDQIAVQSGPNHVLYFDKPRPTKDVLKDWKWWAPTLVEFGATWYDIHQTTKGLKVGNCVEANGDPHPSAAQLWAGNMIANAALYGFGFVINKYNVKWHDWIYLGGTTYGTTLHIHGGLSWNHCM